MSLRVFYLCAYYSHYAHEHYAQRTQDLWDSYQFCNSVKKGKVNGYFHIPLSGKPIRIDEDNVYLARAHFGSYIGKILRENPIDNCVLCPVPSKDSFIEDNFRSLVMLREAVISIKENRPEIIPLLCYNEEVQPASSGGPRGYYAVINRIDVISYANRPPVILVDDICTTGGSLLACRDKLIDDGFDVPYAIVCGRTVDDIEPAFRPRELDLEDIQDLGF